MKKTSKIIVISATIALVSCGGSASSGSTTTTPDSTEQVKIERLPITALPDSIVTK